MEFLVIFLLAIAIVIIIAIAQAVSKSKKSKELGTIKKIPMGKYLAGFSNTSKPTDNVDCAITDDNFIFISGFGDELGRIPRDSINQITFSDKSQISQRLTVTRMLTLGVFSLAAPKKKKQKEFCVIIDWDDENSEKQNSVFEFSGMMSDTLANQATNTLNQYKKSKVQRLKFDEKKCPYCAEIIKKEAKICKFCNSKL